MTKYLLFLMLSIGLLSTSCTEKEQAESYILFYNSDDAQITTDTVNVNLNSSHELLIKVTFLGNRPKYFKKVNAQDKTELSEVVIRKENFDIPHVQDSEVTLGFSEDSFNSGDIFTVIVETNSDQGFMSNEITYKIN